MSIVSISDNTIQNPDQYSSFIDMTLPISSNIHRRSWLLLSQREVFLEQVKPEIEDQDTTHISDPLLITRKAEAQS